MSTTEGSTESRPLVLLSNDDGVTAPGLVALHEALSVHADVVVCAPESNQSATSHSLTLHRILRLSQVRDGVFVLDGTPADCVYVALHGKGRVLKRRPDLVVSGMNHGPNLGADVFYSGTVAAAREAALRGIPALAASAHLDASAAPAARLAAEIAMELYRRAASRQGRPVLLNLNIPAGDRWALRATKLGQRLYAEEVDYRVDPRGRDYLWIGGSAPVRHGAVEGSDTEAYDAGVASVTPLALDLCDVSDAPFAASVASAIATDR